MLYHNDDDYTPSAEVRIRTVAELDNTDLKVGHKLALLDQSILAIFQDFQLSKKAISTVFIAECLPDLTYPVGIIDIVLQDCERVVVPTITVVATLDQIREALSQTEALRCDTPSAIHTSYREQARTGLDYDAIATKLKQKGQVSIRLPKGRDQQSFRTSIHTALKKRGLDTATEIKGGDAIFTIAQ
jgi:hypothetical protein